MAPETEHDGREVRDAGVLRRHVIPPLRRLGRCALRGSVREVHDDDEIALILLRDEAGRLRA